MSISRRPFGVEIECCNLPHEEVCLWHFRQAGILSYHEDQVRPRKVKKYSYWNVGWDSSIEGPGLRLEFSSRILAGPEGLEEVRKVCRILQKLGAQVNKSCGLHVHVSNKGLTPVAMFTMLQRYADWENQIDSYMSPNRRENRNSCANSVRSDADDMLALYGDSFERSEMLRSRHSFADSVASGHRKKLDFDSHYEHNTTEFRHHHGTIDPVEVTSWIKFCLNFTEVSADLAPRTRRSTKRARDVGPLMGLDSRTRQHFLLQAEKHS